MPPRRTVDDEDEGPATPQTSGSYAIFRDAARKNARLLDRVVLLLTKRIDLRDPERIAMVKEIAEELRRLGDAFDGWPDAPPVVLAWERVHRVAALKRALRSAAEILDEVPTEGMLGKVRFEK